MLDFVSSRQGISKFLLSLTLILIGTGLLWISAKIHLPFWPVPLTMQTYVILLLASLYGWQLGGLTVLAYLGEGLLGLPVFSGTPERGLGVSYMLGPTGGYLFGFIIATLFVGWLVPRCLSFGGLVTRWLVLSGVMTIGHSLIYLFGVAYLTLFLDLNDAIAVGLLPFLLGDTLKIILASTTVLLIWRLKS